MPSAGYLLVAIVVSGLVTFTLRAVPFAVLAPLRDATIVHTMARWMPIGILAILALATTASSIGDEGRHAFPALISIGVTITAHLGLRRHTALSVALGTACYVLLTNIP